MNMWWRRATGNLIKNVAAYSQVTKWYSLLMWEDPFNVLKPHYRFESCPDYSFGTTKHKSYVHIMNIKTKIITLLVLTSITFVVLLAFRDIMGMFLMCIISIYLGVALKSIKQYEQ